MTRRKRTAVELLNMNFGFFGIQFGWTLQMNNMSAIYQYLGADADRLPLLWLAAPLTGLLVQPIIGILSDRTWGPLGRRRPYFLAGAVLSTIALVAMPNVHTVLAAAMLLWLMDASINVSMEPFRAFVSDLLPEEQRTRGFALQSLLIGLACFVAGLLPWLLEKLHLQQGTGPIPIEVRYAFYLGAFAFITAVSWTVLTTPEYPPQPQESAGRPRALRLPGELWRLAPVQIATWSGMFCLFMFAAPAVARQVFGATDPNSPEFRHGVIWYGVCTAVQNFTTFVFSFFLVALARGLGQARAHALCLTIGGLGLMRPLPGARPLRALVSDDRPGHRLGFDPQPALCHSGPQHRRGHRRPDDGCVQLLHRAPADRGQFVLWTDHEERVPRE